MVATFQVIPLSSNDLNGMDAYDEPRLSYPDALMTAQQLKFQGQAFRVLVEGECSTEERNTLVDLGALIS
jgi:hypothetical protein